MLTHGMVIYSTANAAGYYREREEWPMTIMFLFFPQLAGNYQHLPQKRKNIIER